MGQLTSRGVIMHSSIPQPQEPDCHDVPVGGSAFLRLAIAVRARLRQRGSLMASQCRAQAMAALWLTGFPWMADVA